MYSLLQLTHFSIPTHRKANGVTNKIQRSASFAPISTLSIPAWESPCANSFSSLDPSSLEIGIFAASGSVSQIWMRMALISCGLAWDIASGRSRCEEGSSVGLSMFAVFKADVSGFWWVSMFMLVWEELEGSTESFGLNLFFEMRNSRLQEADSEFSVIRVRISVFTMIRVDFWINICLTGFITSLWHGARLPNSSKLLGLMVRKIICELNNIIHRLSKVQLN